MRGCDVRRGVVVMTVAAALALPSAVLAQGDAARARRDLGWGAAAIVANLVYVPVKVAYATLGGIAGGVAYAVTGGEQAAAERIWVPSIGGDYVLTADMVAGRQQIYFSGVTDPEA